MWFKCVRGLLAAFILLPWGYSPFSSSESTSKRYAIEALHANGQSLEKESGLPAVVDVLARYDAATMSATVASQNKLRPAL